MKEKIDKDFRRAGWYYNVVGKTDNEKCGQ
jgi:hypothetical protein